MWITDPETGSKSVSLTFLFWGFVLASFKLVFSEIAVLGIKSSVFTGADFALVLGALGGLYGLRKHQNRVKRSTDENK